MEILTLRDPTRGDATAGYVMLDGVFECHSLEDAVAYVYGRPASVESVRGLPLERWKVAKKTAIPEGRYPVTIAQSPRFRKLMISIGEVPGFSGIRAHAGLEPDDSEGCPLLGDQQVETAAGPRIVSGSTRPAVERLQAKIQAALDRGEKVFWTFKQNPAGSREASA